MQFSFGLPLEAAFLDYPCDLIGDGLQEVDLLAAEVAWLDGLHVHHADHLVTRDDRHRQHRREAFLVDLGHPLPTWFGAHVARGERNARVRDPSDDALADPQRRPSDAAAVQTIGRDETQHRIGLLEEIQR